MDFYKIYKIVCYSLYYSILNKICPFIINDINNLVKNIVLLYFTELERCTLTRDSRYDGFNIENPKLFDKTNIPMIDLSSLKKSKMLINETVLNYMSLIEDYNTDAFNNFCINGNSLVISDDMSLKDSNIRGFYSELDNGNLLFVDTLMSKEKIKNTVIHELTHMSSSYKENGILYSGFSVYNCKTNSSIGMIFNECSTEIICQRLFSGYKTSYPKYLINMIDKIIDIIGFDKFTSLYFSYDFNGLINEMNNYFDDFKSFLIKLDDLYDFNTLNSSVIKNIVFILSDYSLKDNTLYKECMYMIDEALNKKTKSKI